MSFLVGTISGALVAGGVYYGFSNVIDTRTKKLRTDLHALSHQFKVDSAQLSRWNQQVDVLFKSVAEWDKHAAAWVRQVLYGGDATSKEDPIRK